MCNVRRCGLLAASVVGAVLAGCAGVPRGCPTSAVAPPPHLEYEPARWSDLPGWAQDDTRKAWPAFLASCRALGRRAPWHSVCEAARPAQPTSAEVRSFFERHFAPYRLAVSTGGRVDRTGLITGYFEPVVHGRRKRSKRFDTPLYSPPPDLLTVDLSSVYPELKGLRLRGRLEGRRVVPYFSRAELDRDAALQGHAIVWLASPLDAFFLQVQGSGRVVLPDGEALRLRYANENGYPYRSIGRYLVEHGELSASEATMAGIREWAREHPDRVRTLLDADPSVVFFKATPLRDPSSGPRGSLGVPLTPGRSIAVDPRAVPLGAPVYLATTAPGTNAPLQRLVVAEDTGGAIRGPIRADLYCGTGRQAGAQAGAMRQSGSLWLLWPRGAAPPAQGRRGTRSFEMHTWTTSPR